MPKMIRIFYVVLLLATTAFATDVLIRPPEVQEDVVSASQPSDLPFGAYYDSFVRETRQIIDALDLSVGAGKRLFVGYGLYDIDEQYCKYVPMPGQDIDKFNTLFYLDVERNGHTYFMSRETMTYSECRAAAETYGAQVIVPETEAEINYLALAHYKNENLWLGIYRHDCDHQYVTENGVLQHYFNWPNDREPDCKEPYTNVALIGGTLQWRAADSLEKNRCVVEFDGPDYTRPEKICAPWWRLERTYLHEDSNLTAYSNFNIDSMKQVDVPLNVFVCMEYEDQNLTTTTVDPEGYRDVQCTSYYSVNAAPTCIYDMHSELCKVDECLGYVKDVCELKDEYVPYKDYTKGVIQRDGQKVVVRTKDKIVLHQYKCPPSPPSINRCINRQRVAVWPQECPDGTLVYGSPDNPHIVDGELVGLRAMCPDGVTEIESPVDKQDRMVRKCLEYYTEEVNETKIQRCTVDRTYQDFTVNTALGEVDNYEDNASCIRMNRIEEARPPVETIIDYVSRGFSKVAVKKAYVDGRESELLDDNTTSYILDIDTMELAPTFPPIENQQISPVYPDICTPYQDAWSSEAFKDFAPVAEGGHGALKKHIELDSGLIAFGAMEYSACLDIAADYNGSKVYDSGDDTIEDIATLARLGFTTADVYTADANGTVIPTSTAECVLDTATLMDDTINLISAEPVTTFIAPGLNKLQCVELSQCFGFVVDNFLDYGTPDDIEDCRLVEPAVGEEVYYDPQLDDADVIIDYQIYQLQPSSSGDWPRTIDEKHGSIVTHINGYSDIFSIQQFTPGAFAEYTSFYTQHYRDNLISVNGANVSPIDPWPILEEDLIYDYDFKQRTITTRTPDFLNMTQEDFLSMSEWMGTQNVPLMRALHITAILINKTYYLGEEWIDWELYKPMPDHYYLSPYGYDWRVNKGVVLTYYEVDNFFTGTIDGPLRFIQMLHELKDIKTAQFLEMDISESTVDSLTQDIEYKPVLGWPKCKWYEITCDYALETQKSDNGIPVKKLTTSYYFGATNTMSIVVPYIGDYRLKAYDRDGAVLAETTVYKDAFVDTASMVQVADVFFGTNMDLAPDITDGNLSNACRYSKMAEWGGGLSGIYYEMQDDGVGMSCQKSDDAYVKAHAATKITVQPLDMEEAFVVELERPLPFANRTLLVTLGEVESRKYRCFDEYEECSEDGYADVE